MQAIDFVIRTMQALSSLHLMDRPVFLKVIVITLLEVV